MLMLNVNKLRVKVSCAQYSFKFPISISKWNSKQVLGLATSARNDRKLVTPTYSQVTTIS